MIKFFAIAFLAGFFPFFVGCQNKDGQLSKIPESAKDEASSEFDINSCPEEKVDLPNYGDKGQRLKNCFVKFPGEPSRQDKSYYIVEDICGQFTQEFMENMLGRKLSKMELPKVAGINNCAYYLDDKKYVLANLEYLEVENQKIGNESMGRKVEKETKISMDNLIVYEEKGMINVIYLVLGPEKFISLRPSAADVLNNENFIGLAANIADAIKEYK